MERGIRLSWGAERDGKRDRFLRQLGMRVLRIENRLVFENSEGVLEWIRDFLKG